MSSIENFENIIYFRLNILALIVYFVTTLYCSKSNRFGKSFWFLFFAIFLEFAASWFGYEISAYQDTEYFNYLVFVELLIFLISLTLMGVAASKILIEKVKTRIFMLCLFGFVLLSLSYFIFISPNGEMVDNMRYAFPLAGFLYVTFAFFSKIKYGPGFKIATLTTFLISLDLILDFLGVQSIISKQWYIPLVLYIGLSFSLLIIKSDYIAYKLSESIKKNDLNKQQIENIIKLSPFPILISKLTDDKILVANNNAIELFGIRENELDRHKLKDFFLDQDNRKKLNETLEHEGEVRDFEILVKTATGNTPFWLLTSANIINYNNDIGIYLAFQDITSRKNREILLKNQATRDPLTSLFNRRYFVEEANKKIQQNLKLNSFFAIFMLDVDKFKRVNDTYGHKTGDKVLIEIANCAVSALRNSDIVARYGGEEFVIYINVADKDAALAVANRLRETIASLTIPTEDAGKTISVTASIGIGTSETSTDLDTLIKMADTALYKAKNNGRNRCEFFDTETINKNYNRDTLHPLFVKEENEELSLLDGVEANHIMSSNNLIEDDIYNIIPSKDKK